MRVNKYHHKLILIASTLIFIVIFYKFVLQGYVYVYSTPGDVGSDTMYAYYPMMASFSKMIHEWSFDFYSLEKGLGADNLFYISYFCNPVDLVSLIFPVEYLHIGILLSTYIKLLLISLFAFKFFNMICKCDMSKFICTLLWTFSSYIMIWGQHYIFCTNMMNFTIFMYLVQLWLKNDKKYWWGLILFMSFFVINNYYFFYMGGVFSAIYCFSYLWLQNIRMKDIFIKLIKLLFSAILSILIASIFLIPILMNFLDSERTSVLSNVSLWNFVKVYDIKTIIVDIARFVNSDLIGSGYNSNYSGSINYYEDAFLSSSLLFIFSLVYHLGYAEHRRKNLVLFILTIMGLIIPLFTYLITFNPNAFRWTFWIIWVEIICISGFLDFLFLEAEKNKVIKKISLFSIIIFLIVLAILGYGEFNHLIEIRMSILLMMIFIMLSYLLVIYRWKGIHNRRYILMGSIIMEIILVNIFPVSFRGIEKNETFQQKYFDGTQQLTEYISIYDDSLYRIDKDYTSVFFNDPLIQHFNGYSTYSSVNTKEAWSLAQNYQGEFNGYSNYINHTNSLFRQLTGAKYKISTLNNLDLNLIAEENDKYLYEYQDYIPFGYLYHSQLKSENYTTLNTEEKIALLSKGFVSDESFDMPIEEINIVKQRTSILDDINDFENCILQKEEFGLQVNGTADDMQIMIDMKESYLPGSIIEIDITASIETDVRVYYSYGQPYNETETYSVHIQKGKNYVSIPLMKDGVKSIRIDPSGIKQDLIIHSLYIDSISQEWMNSNIEELRSNGVENASFSNSQYRAQIKNDSNKNMMLQIPVVYSKNWRAQLNGNYTNFYNINNGFVGIIIPPGSYSVSLEYTIPIKVSYIYISLLGVIVYLFIVYRNKKTLSDK